MKKMKAARLILDFDLYPRNNLDAFNVRSMVDALVAGVELPPVIIDGKSKRVTDGFHRVRAYLRFGGEEVEIDVIEKNYKDEGAMFLDAVKYNASHGARLDQADRVHCTIIAERLKISAEDMAGVLHIPIEKLGKLANRTATCGKLRVPLKQTNRHMSGKNLSKKQREANERSSGMNQQFYVNQIIDLIEADFLDTENKNLMDRLVVLDGLLDKVLAASAA